MASQLPSLVLLMVALPLVLLATEVQARKNAIYPRTTADRALDRGAAERCLQNIRNSFVANPGGNDNYIAGVETTLGTEGYVKAYVVTLSN